MAKETNGFARLNHVGEEEVQADIWRCISGFTEMAVAKCAIELGISDFLETHQEPVPLNQLSSALSCSASSLHRILRFLTNRGIFKLVPIENGEMGYLQTPVARLLKRDGENSMAALVLLESSPVILAPWHYLSTRILSNENTGPFSAAHGKDVWEYAKTNPEHSKLINDALACHARWMLVEAFPWINGINFDLPHVASVAPPCHGVVHVEGYMFHSVPNAQAVFLMSVLHDWGDEECIQILKKCMEAIPKDTGKVIIVEAVLDEKIGKGKSLKDVGIMLDMIMMAHTTNGKERTAKEWAHILSAAGFSRHSILQIPAIEPVIVAYP
ncbi:hypothetical protein H5410_009948 [Solanum commersonii]|uniref:O-methyltransferase n=1 Tax=Solanum commersonii TaxID=4109 RepID=A0A9J6AKX9_SOLCO|nr:hypothetical protein H5410_009948 [Solanum commersonii]